jgi:WD40 repeat protein
MYVDSSIAVILSSHVCVYNYCVHVYVAADKTAKVYRMDSNGTDLAEAAAMPPPASVLHGHGKGINDVAWMDGGACPAFAATASDDSSVRLWDVSQVGSACMHACMYVRMHTCIQRLCCSTSATALRYLLLEELIRYLLYSLYFPGSSTAHYLGQRRRVLSGLAPDSERAARRHRDREV